MKKKLAIICASSDQIPLVNKAKEMGIETHCFSWDRENYTDCKGIADFFHPISILEKEQILEVCKEIKIDGVTSMIYDFAVPTVAYVAQGMGLTGNNYEDSLIPSNKFSMRQAFQRHGVSSPRFAVAGGSVDVTGFRYPLIVKPTDRCSSIGVTKVEKEEDLQEAIQRAQENSYRKEAIIEEFLSGIELSVDAISWNGKHYILVIKERELTAGVNCDVKIAGHYPLELPSDIQQKIINETQKALDAIKYRYGASNTEFRLDKDGNISILEVNPRMAGEYSHILMKLYNGYDVVKGVIDVALGQFEPPVITETKYSGIYFWTKRSEWVKYYIDHWKEDPDIVQIELFDRELRDTQNNVDRGGYFIYQSAQKRRWAPAK
jgi:biotin carboxylase